jgi:hypothetical protein
MTFVNKLTVPQLIVQSTPFTKAVNPIPLHKPANGPDPPEFNVYYDITNP